ncbi:hypothetical protein JK359_36480 [Streptomyces actinomycinicus]|uniref:Uncharacterized protein n=1 Tax=Streptomyces actinomycinicus TaxID=1695166 RepID=A0A937JT39_9ACTN|nr:hypothetical protein [Streptomyces actinomycinicus]MBL1087387.1 hypothetical protein [Streptomyces actinomycinicus]
MKSQPCPRNHTQENHAAAGSVLCVPCIKTVEHNLHALPGLYQECLYQVSPTGRRTNPTKVSGSRRKDHLDVSVLDARHNIVTILESWSGMVVEKLGATAPPRTVLSLARFLILNLQWLAGQAPAVDFADEIEGLVAELRRTIDPEPRELHTPVRHCVVDDCPGTISASPQRGAGAGSSITCSSGHSWEVCEWLSLRKLMERQRKGVNA